MIVNKFSIKNQQKITVGILKAGFYTTFKWFHNFDSKKDTIVKVELSSIDIEKIFSRSLFYKNGLTGTEYTECLLEDIIDRNIFIPYQVSHIQLGHRILLKRKLTHDNLHISIYCFKGTLKAINALLEANSLPWSSKATRTESENKIIRKLKYPKTIRYEYELSKFEDYELVETIFDVDTMEQLLQVEEIPSWIKELIQERLILFSESQEQDENTYLDDYNW